MNFKNNIFYKKVKDHSVTQEVFELHHNEEYDLLITFPKPSIEKLPSYYESEDYISHTDNKRSLIEKVYHLVKKISIKNKLKLISSLSENGKILDIGSGTGDFLLAAKQAGWQTIGYEPNIKAKTISKQKGIELTDEINLLENNSFDVITMWHVLEHVPNLEEYISELKRLLKPKGTIIIAVPNFKSFDAEFYGRYWAAYDVPRHIWHFSKQSISKIFLEKKLQVVNVLPMKFDSFYVSLLSERYRTGKNNPVRAFFVGLKSNLNAKKTKKNPKKWMISWKKKLIN